MKRLLSTLFSILFVLMTAPVVLTGCSETEESGEFDNWQTRNDSYINTLSESVDNNITPETATEGQMFRILSYKLDGNLQWDADKYVYCKIIKKGTGTETPNYSDSIRMNYRAHLIPSENYPKGFIFDQSYKTDTLNTLINVPASFKPSGLVDGMISAVQYMKVGDIWEITIPYGLGYVGRKVSSIPSYSTLIFDVNLTETALAGTSLSPR